MDPKTLPNWMPGNHPASRPAVLDHVKTIMRRDLKLGDDIAIDETTPFIGGEADIDSLDILLMLASVEREFAIRISSEEAGRRVFQNVGTLVDYLMQQLGAGAEQGGPAPAAGAAHDDPLRHLPHQPPFRFVSRLTQLVAGQSAQGVWSVSGEEDFFKGHFPGRPIVPGVLIAEALAQLAGLAAHLDGAEGRLAQMDVRFEAAVAPPADIQLRCRVARSVAGLIQYEVEAWCGTLPAARGTVTLNWSGPAEK
jgi:3-hydroxyacyl-[acyl-carrier-protein] dehydratase